MRQATPLKKVILDMRTNTICWNPMEAFIFTAANEDYNLYTFDMRALDTPVMVHMDHVSAVLDVDYSPTGKEFVSASFDKSIRIFPVDKSRSRYVATNKPPIFIYFFLSWSLFIFVERLVVLYDGAHTLVLCFGATTFTASSMGETSACWQFLSLNRIFMYII
ncbi:DDB1- and CUL4-associated factor 13-like [Myotis lucifugus]|uniref:DDB1- and CUL4-associated factor 13-like n=1 Tax=Myotis lucifugus TaxID=59463 RepID=UPI0003C43D36|nr:DDB1- and CUL4-associated factor 13-like [Myotis lucifugus]